MVFVPARIPHEEFEDFFEACTRSGFDPSVLELSARDDVVLGYGSVTRIITLSRGYTTVDVDGSRGTDWIFLAVDFVKTGMFKNRIAADDTRSS